MIASQAFNVTLQPSGRSFKCSQNEPILQSGLDSGLFMPYSCRSGVCKTCRGRVITGDIDFGAVHPKYLTDQDKAQGFALLCCAKPLSDLVIEVMESDPTQSIKPKFMPARVLKKELLAPDVLLLTLGLPANEPTLFLAGQYIEILLQDGARRSYSIANMSSNEGVRQIELHIRHMVGGRFTDHAFLQLKLRDIFRLQMPLGSFFLREDSEKSVILMASGTGFAPIKSIIESSLQKNSKRPMTIYWGGRKRSDIYMLELAQSWQEQYPHMHFIPVLSEPTDDCAWTGRKGFVHQAVMDDFPDMRNLQVYACGAPIVVESGRKDFVALCGLPESEFYADSFLSEADKLPMS